MHDLGLAKGILNSEESGGPGCEHYQAGTQHLSRRRAFIEERSTDAKV